jgi:hypothetical protein
MYTRLLPSTTVHHYSVLCPFYGGNTGSIPVRDAKEINRLRVFDENPYPARVPDDDQVLACRVRYKTANGHAV